MSSKENEVDIVSLDDVEEGTLPLGVAEFLKRTSGVSPDNPMDAVEINKMFVGQEGVAESLIKTGVAHVPHAGGKSMVLGAGFNVDGKLVTTAAAIPRTPGRSETFLGEVADFSSTTTSRTQLLELYERIYAREGLVNNAINKSAALVATDGQFKVRYVRGQRGVSADVKAEEFRKLLQFWQENVNGRPEDAAITGARGLTAFMSQGVRLCLKQGDHFGRQIWTQAKVPSLKGKAFKLPMTLQTFSASTIEIPEGLEGTPAEMFYWKPPSDFIELLRNPGDPEVKKQLDKLIPSEIKSALLADGQYLLDQALMIHIKHRGTDTGNYGESMIEAAMNEIAYKRALQALDIVTIENLINRLVIILVGSDQKDSVYHKQEVSSARMQMMANMMRRVGPAATIIWPGPDIEIKEVGAYNSILDMDERYKQSESRIRSALGVPSALMSGDSGDGKAAGWAAIVGVAAELVEVQSQYKQVFRTIAERIAVENGFDDVDVVWEFNQDMLVNKDQHVNMILKSVQGGLISLQTAVEELGFSFEAEEVRMLNEVSMDYRTEPFGAPRALEQTLNNEGGESPEGEGGRPKKEETEEPDPRKDKETQKTEENK